MTSSSSPLQEYRTDERLRGYFATLFSEGAVLRGYIVRRTWDLDAKLRRLKAVRLHVECPGYRSGCRACGVVAQPPPRVTWVL